MRRSIQKIVSKFSNLGGQYKKFYFAQFAFFLSLSLLCIALNAMGTLRQGDYLVFCFFIIATIGISHGSLDGKKGEYILKKKIFNILVYNFLRDLYFFGIIGFVGMAFISDCEHLYFFYSCSISFWQ